MWVYYIYLAHPKYNIYNFDHLAHKFKTGDLILFHALDNINPIFIGSYYGHVGVVYVDPDTPNAEPKIFEAFNPTTTMFYPKEVSNGICISDLRNRINSYRGYTFYKELLYPVDISLQRGFKELIEFAIFNMRYNESVVINHFNKFIFNDSINTLTNCGELAYISLIKLGIIFTNRFNERKHHLRWLSNVSKLDNNEYKNPVYVLSNYMKC